MQKQRNSSRSEAPRKATRLNAYAILKAEITRVARKQVKAETEALKSASARHRSDIAALTRQVAVLQQQSRQAAAQTDTSQHRADEARPEVRHRFSAKRLAAQRKRLGLSAEALGKLIGVSGLSIYHWEGGKTRPRAVHLPAIAALKTLSPKAAAAIVATR